MQFIFNSFVAIAFLVANAGALPRPAAEPGLPFSIVNVDGGQTVPGAAGTPMGVPAGGPMTVTVTQAAQKIIQTVTVTTTFTMNNDLPAATTDNAASATSVATNAAVITTDGVVLTKPANAPPGATLSVIDNASTTETIGLPSDRPHPTQMHPSEGVVTLTMQPTPTTTVFDNGQWHTFYPSGRTTMTMKTEPTTVAW